MDLNNAAWCLSIRAPIVATPGLIKFTLNLGFRLNHRDNLGTVLHQFVIGQQTSSARKFLKACSNQHQVITGGVAAPYLADEDTLIDPDGVSLPATLAMARGSHTRLRVVLVTLFRPYHPTVLAMKDVNT